MEEINNSNGKAKLDEADRLDRIRTVIILWALFIIMAAGGIFSVIISQKEKEDKALPMNTSEILSDDMHLSGNGQELRDKIKENFMAYLYKAYIVLGTYPDARLVKISDKVERNDYNWTKEFFTPEGELYYKRYIDGDPNCPTGRIAIDVSEYQNEIDWPAVKSAGVEVAIIRAGYRGYGEKAALRQDKMFEKNMKGAIDAGIEVGVYFFSEAINREEGVEEAKFVLEMLKGYDVKQPVVIDTEYIYDTPGVRANDISVEDRTAAVVGFCETVKEAGYIPMVYASRDQFLFNLDIEQVGQYEMWLAAYDTPIFPYHTEGYQYSPYGLMKGITGNVDLDVWLR